MDKDAKTTATPDKRVTIIAAVAGNGAIGYGNGLLYRLPDDMKRFRKLTVGNTVIMGRRTYESLPHGALPDRRNIVLSKSGASCPGCEVYASLDLALESCVRDEAVFVIGGATVYREALPIASRLCLTIVHDTPERADAFFPDFSAGWKETSREYHPSDGRHAVPFSFVDYVR